MNTPCFIVPIPNCVKKHAQTLHLFGRWLLSWHSPGFGVFWDNSFFKLENLVFHSVTNVKGEGYASTYHTTIYLKEGDVLIFEEEGRGYIKPVEAFVTVKEAVEELKCIEDL